MPKMNVLENSVERKVRGERKKEVSWPKSIIVTQEHLDDKEFMKKHPHARLHTEVCDPVPLFLRSGEKREMTLIDTLRNELRKEQIKQQVIEDHYDFDNMTEEQQRAFFEDESDFELDDDHPSILSAYEQAGLVYDAKPEIPTNPETPVNTTENDEPPP